MVNRRACPILIALPVFRARVDYNVDVQALIPASLLVRKEVRVMGSREFLPYTLFLVDLANAMTLRREGHVV